MNKEEVVKGKNLFDEEKIIDTGIKEPFFISIPFDEYKKLQEENEELKKDLENLKEVERQICCEELITKDGYQNILRENAELKENNLSYQKELSKAWKENEELKEEIEHQYKQYIKDHTEVIENLKKEQELKIRNKIKELEKTKHYITSMYAIGVLEELLGDE